MSRARLALVVGGLLLEGLAVLWFVFPAPGAAAIVGAVFAVIVGAVLERTCLRADDDERGDIAWVSIVSGTLTAVFVLVWGLPIGLRPGAGWLAAAAAAIWPGSIVGLMVRGWRRERQALTDASARLSALVAALERDGAVLPEATRRAMLDDLAAQPAPPLYRVLSAALPSADLTRIARGRPGGSGALLDIPQHRWTSPDDYAEELVLAWRRQNLDLKALVTEVSNQAPQAAEALQKAVAPI